MNLSLLMAATVAHWAVEPISTIQRLPDAVPADGEKGGVVRIVAAQDEYEPGSFVVRSDEDLGKVTLELGEFASDAGDVFPAEALDLKVIKCWYQNKNAWFSYFGDTGGFKLVPELLLNDEDLIRTDDEKQANYARLVEADGRVHERWLNPPRQIDRRTVKDRSSRRNSFQFMRPNFRDAKTLQPVTLAKDVSRQFFLTAHVAKGTKPGVYRGEVKILGEGERRIASVPVAITVLDFELPQPRAYQQPDKDFLVSFYAYHRLEEIMAYNGYDYELALRQKRAIIEDEVKHNHMVQFMSSGLCEESRLTYEMMKELGQRTDVFIGGVTARPEKDLELPKIRAAAATRLFGHRNMYMTYGDEPGIEFLRGARPVYARYQDWGFRSFIAGSETCWNRAGHVYDWFNMNQPPTSTKWPDRWNKLGDNNLAWYAKHHVGTEDPDLNRRESGLGAWLAGYTALCNYAHHLGPYNDDTITYRPMVLAYGTSDGVIDTLQWEGFREGIDDIRYGTVLTALAREAAHDTRREVKYLGRLALKHLADFDRDAGVLSACRAEMVRHIQLLRKAIGHEAVLAAKAKTGYDEPVADVESDIAKKMAAATTVEEKGRIYERYLFWEKAYDLYVANGKLLCAAKLADGDEWRQYDKAKECWLKLLQDEKQPKADRAQALFAVYGIDLALAKRYEAELLPTEKGAAKALLNTVRYVYFRPSELRYFYDEKFDAELAVVESAKKLAASAGESLSFLIWDTAVRAAALGHREADAVRLANEAIAALGESLKPEERYFFEIAAAVFAGKDIESVKPADDVAPAKRAQMASVLACVYFQRGDEAKAVEIDKLRQRICRRPEKKRYTVTYSKKRIEGPEDWAGVKDDPMDRQYGGRLDFLVSDVSTGDRGAVGSAKDEKKEVAQFAAVADDWGLHLRFAVKDPKARDVERGLVGPDSYEGYIAPGEGKAYVCLLMTADKDCRCGFFNTSYDNDLHRRLRDEIDTKRYRARTVFTDDTVTTYLSFSWEQWALVLPKDGDVWNFENMRWSRTGCNAWNGTESIHGRSTWGELVFALPSEARRAIIERCAFAARKTYQDEKVPRRGGELEIWSDTELGDRDFQALEVAPLEARLDAEIAKLEKGLPDEELERFAAETLSDLVNIRQRLAERRRDYLRRQESTTKDDVRWPVFTSAADISLTAGEAFRHRVSWSGTMPVQVEMWGMKGRKEDAPAELKFDPVSRELTGTWEKPGDYKVYFVLLDAQFGKIVRQVQTFTMHVAAPRKSPAWLAKSTIYQVWPRAFTKEGTIAAATKRLGELKELGIGIVYLAPVCEMDDDKNPEFWSTRQKWSGYTSGTNPYRIKDYTKVDPEFGTEDDLKAFVAAAHKLGMKTMLDVVYLHCGPNAAFRKEHPDWIKADAGTSTWGFPKLNFESKELRAHLIAQLVHWTKDVGFDGFRCDVGDQVPLDFWREARAAVEAVKKEVVFLDDGASAELGEVFDLWYGVKSQLRGLYQIMDGRHPASYFIEQYEKETALGTPSARQIRYTDNHDISNDEYELRQETKWGEKRCEAALALCFALDGVPMLATGQECAWAKRVPIYGKAPVDRAAMGEAGTKRFKLLRNLIALKKTQPFSAWKLEWNVAEKPEEEIDFDRVSPDGKDRRRCRFNLATGAWSIDGFRR